MIRKSMSQIHRLVRSRALRIAVTGLGLALLIRGINMGQAAAVLGQADLRLELLGVGLTTLGLSCAVLAWAAVVRASGASVALPRLASWYLQGVFVGHVTPSSAGGDATRATGLSRAIGHGRGLASLAASRMASGLSMAICGFIGALVAHVDFGVPVVLAAAAYLGLMLGIWWLALGAHRLTRTLHRHNRRVVASAVRAVTPVTEALASFRETPGALFGCVGLAVAGWMLNIFAMQSFAAAVGVHQPPSIFAVVVPISLLATMVPVAINGIGLREGVLVGLMVHLGEGSARSGALAILIDLQLIPFAIIGAWLFIRSHRRAPAVLIPAGAV
jgi:glycosyltransferase 2 family protein